MFLIFATTTKIMHTKISRLAYSSTPVSCYETELLICLIMNSVNQKKINELKGIARLLVWKCGGQDNMK
jgi:hypothetical protein